MIRSTVPCALAALLLLAPGRVRAAPGDVRTLVIEGRVADAEGFPVAKTRLDTGPRAGVDVDENGHYLVSLVVGSVPGLTSTPFHVALRPHRKGWQIGLPGTRDPLVIEMRLASGPDRHQRIEVRSNDRWVAQALADSISSGGSLHLVVHFLAQPGPEASGAQPAVGAVTYVPLRELDWPAPQALAAAPPKAPERTAVETPAPPAPSRPAPRRAGGARAQAGGDIGPGAARSADRGSAHGSQGSQGSQGTRGSTGARSATRSYHLFPSADEALNEPPPAAQPARRSAAAASPAPHVATAPATPPAPEQTSNRAVAAPPPANDARASATPAVVADAQRPEPAAPDRAPHPAPPSSRAIAPPAPGPRGAIDVHETGAGAGDDEQPSSAVRVWGGRTIPGGEARREQPGDCGCIVQGTIEVRSGRPLADPLRVQVSVEQHPALADTVELFMGSPRPFTLRGLPCGQHRLNVTILSRRRFRVASPEALGLFDCSSGALHHPRIVLEGR